jgi:ABC-type sugar transport system ATPase subunit
MLAEVMEVCDEVTVLRDGNPVMEGRARSDLSVGAIVDAMLGEQSASGSGGAPGEEAEKLAEEIKLGPAEEGEAGALELSDVSSGPLRGVSLRAKPGEIVGLAGVAGAGHLTVFELVSGLRRADGGKITLPGGRPVPRGLRRAIGAGVALVSGDRRRFGLMLDKPIWENIGQVRAVGLAASGMLVRARELRQHARGHMERLSIQAKSVDERVELLSGGNQQKVVFAKWLDAEPAVLLLDDPTRGVDVGAKAEMHSLIRASAAAGAVVLLCSTDIDEIASVCDRVIVFFQGRVCAELSGDDVEEHAVLEAMNTGALERPA